jgi:MATE family multidrug resistance protein
LATLENKNRSPSHTVDILRLAWPIYVAQMAILANAVIDTVMAGHLSTIDLAAIGIGASIQATVFMSLLGVLLALPPLVAQLYGAGRRDAIGLEIHQSIWVALVLAVIAIIALTHPGPFIALSELRPGVEEKVRSYLAASAWGVPGTLAFRLFFGFSTGIGRPRPVMAFNLLALALKVPLNYLFMYGMYGFPAMGAPGCAVATAIDANLIAVLAWSWCLTRDKYAEFNLHARFSLPDWKAILSFMRLGVPIGLTFFADVTAFTFMALFIARLGPVYSAAHQIAANIAVMAYMIPLALSNAISVLVGQSIGAGQPGNARHLSWTGIRLGLSIAVGISLVLWTNSERIAALYTSQNDVRGVAAHLIMLVGFYHLADALQATTVNALRGYKKSGVPMLIYTTTLWGLGIGGGVILGLTDRLGPARGAAGFWIAAVASLGLVGLLVSLYLDRVSRAPQFGTSQIISR